jgi:hypothetical protein
MTAPTSAKELVLLRELAKQVRALNPASKDFNPGIGDGKLNHLIDLATEAEAQSNLDRLQKSGSPGGPLPETNTGPGSPAARASQAETQPTVPTEEIKWYSLVEAVAWALLPPEQWDAYDPAKAEQHKATLAAFSACIEDATPERTQRYVDMCGEAFLLRTALSKVLFDPLRVFIHRSVR